MLFVRLSTLFSRHIASTSSSASVVQGCRAISVSSSVNGKSESKKPSKTVFISQSHDVFTNLALEDWLYKNFDFTNQHILLLWRNKPSVVIGRHQNPWIETSVTLLKQHQIDLARRNSGGGTVYHDLGNLNCTFFTPRSEYNRKNNLEVICKALKQEWNLPLGISQREDIMFEEEYKVSGTAAKLGRNNAYHHCTVLVDSDLKNLGTSLDRTAVGIQSNATTSTKTPVKNLNQIEEGVTTEKVLSVIGNHFLQNEVGDPGQKTPSLRQNGFQMVNPGEDWFPGITEIRQELMSWDWIYGKTPTFSLIRSFPIPPQFIQASTATGPDPEFTIELKVTKGIIQDVTMKLPDTMKARFAATEESVNVISPLKGQMFSEDVVNVIDNCFEQPSVSTLTEADIFVANCMKQMVQTV